MSEPRRKESTLTELYARKRHHEEKIAYWKKQERDISEELRKHTEQLSAIEKKLERIQGREIFITTHFVKRFRERVNVNAAEVHIKKQVLTDKFVNIVHTLGGKGEFPVDIVNLLTPRNE